MFRGLCIGVEVGGNLRFFWRSFKCLQLEDEDAKREELKVVSKYWVVYGLLHVFEIYIERLISWFPMYYSYKLFLLLLIFFPALNGADIVYHEIAEPELLAIEESVDETLGIISGYWQSVTQGTEDVIQGVRTSRDNFVQGIADGRDALVLGFTTRRDAVVLGFTTRRDAIAQGYQRRKAAFTQGLVSAFTFNIQFPSWGRRRAEPEQQRNRRAAARQPPAQEAPSERWFIGRQWDAMKAYMYPVPPEAAPAAGGTKRREKAAGVETRDVTERRVSKKRIKNKVNGALEKMLDFQEQ